MRFKLDENSVLTAYSYDKSLIDFDIELEMYNIEIDDETGIETKTLTGLVPLDLDEKELNYGVNYFKFDGEKIVINENYVEPTEPEVEEQPNPVEVLGQQVAMLSIDNANLKQQNEALGKQTATLSLDNANMKEQNKILGQSLTELKLEVAQMKGGEI